MALVDKAPRRNRREKKKLKQKYVFNILTTSNAIKVHSNLIAMLIAVIFYAC